MKSIFLLPWTAFKIIRMTSSTIMCTLHIHLSDPGPTAENTSTSTSNTAISHICAWLKDNDTINNIIIIIMSI